MQLKGIDRPQDSIEAIKRSLVDLSDELKRILNSGLNFDDNHDFLELEHTFTTVDTEEDITHTLGRIPEHFIVVNKDAGAVIYESGTTHTSTSIYLMATATCTVTMYIF